MTKTDLINTVAEKTDLSKKDSEKAISALLDSITEALAAGDRVQIVGFGTFEPRERKAREGRNPSNGEPIALPASIVPAFKAGKSLKDAVSK